MAAGPPPEGWDLKGGMPAALDGASDSCPELALVELTPEAFLLSSSTTVMPKADEQLGMVCCVLIAIGAAAFLRAVSIQLSQCVVGHQPHSKSLNV